MLQSAVAGRTRRIGLNAHLLNLSGNYRSAGINWYIYHLLGELTRQASPSEFDFTVFLGDSRAREHFGELHVECSRWPTYRPVLRIAWEQLVLPFALRKSGAELFHAMAFAGPLVNTLPWIVTIYDTSFERYPESFNAANRTYLNWAVRHAVRHANRVIAISESTKRDLVAHYRLSPDRVSVVYGGTDAAFSPAPGKQYMEDLRTRRELPEKMILHVGTIEPRKNIAQLVRAFARARRSAHLPHCLVLIGARGWKHAEVDAAIEEEQVSDVVHFAGYVPADELPDWFRAADLFVYPSRYEGFGLPPLEAMACGTPVVASNSSSLPEVVGDAGLLVWPDDVNGLAEAIVRVLKTPVLRDEMRERGLAQAAKFSWARTARETLDVYRAVLAQRSEHSSHAGAIHASA